MMKRLDEKKLYSVKMTQDSLYSIGVMAVIGTLSKENRHLKRTENNKEDPSSMDVVWWLKMNSKQRIAFEEVAKDYILNVSLMK